MVISVPRESSSAYVSPSAIISILHRMECTLLHDPYSRTRFFEHDSNINSCCVNEILLSNYPQSKHNPNMNLCQIFQFEHDTKVTYWIRIRPVWHKRPVTSERWSSEWRLRLVITTKTNDQYRRTSVLLWPRMSEWTQLRIHIIPVLREMM